MSGYATAKPCDVNTGRNALMPVQLIPSAEYAMVLVP